MIIMTKMVPMMMVNGVGDNDYNDILIIKKYKHLFAKTPVGIQTQAGPHYVVTFKSVGESD